MEKIRSKASRLALATLALPALIAVPACSPTAGDGGVVAETASALTGVASTTSLGNLSLALARRAPPTTSACGATSTVSRPA
jgi:hypothetical protein